jgi:hypothetical protein
MAKKKRGKSSGGGRRKAAAAAGFKATTGAALGVGLGRYGNRVLNAMPAGFESYADGKGKGPTSNFRVKLAAGATIYSVVTKNKSVRRWAPMAGFMLGLSLQQHALTYDEDIDIADMPIELHDGEEAAQQQDLLAKAAAAVAKTKKK